MQTPFHFSLVCYQHRVLFFVQMAAASTKRYTEGNPLSFLDGIPVAVKEEYDVVSHRVKYTYFYQKKPCPGIT